MTSCVRSRTPFSVFQEDNLQHLALFTEYGRIAIQGGKGEGDGEEEVLLPEEEIPFQRLEFLVSGWVEGQPFR